MGENLRFMGISYANVSSAVISFDYMGFENSGKHQTEVFSAIALGVVLSSCCVIRFYTKMIKGSTTINELFPHKTACMFALGLYLVLGVTSSVIQDFVEFVSCPSPRPGSQKRIQS